MAIIFTLSQDNPDELQAAALVLQQHDVGQHDLAQCWFFENFKRDLHTNVAPR